MSDQQIVEAIEIQVYRESVEQLREADEDLDGRGFVAATGVSICAGAAARFALSIAAKSKASKENTPDGRSPTGGELDELEGYFGDLDEAVGGGGGGGGDASGGGDAGGAGPEGGGPGDGGGGGPDNGEPTEPTPPSGDYHLDLVRQIRDQIQPRSEAGAFEVVKRVAWALRGEQAGLLLKPSGENIITWKGRSFSVSRVCYPSGRIFKILSDAGNGGKNGAQWVYNDTVDPARYVAAIDPSS